MLIRAMVLYLRIRYNIFLKHSIAFTYCLHIKGQLFFLFFLYVLLRPKIKFYLFAIAYLPTLLLPTQLFFPLFQKFFFFFFFFFAVSIFQFQSEILNLYELMRKTPTGIAFIPHFLSLFLL